MMLQNVNIDLSCVDAYCLDATIPLHQHLPRSRPPPRLITKAVQPQRAISIPMKTKNLRLRCLHLLSLQPRNQTHPILQNQALLLRSRNRNIPTFPF